MKSTISSALVIASIVLGSASSMAGGDTSDRGYEKLMAASDDEHSSTAVLQPHAPRLPIDVENSDQHPIKLIAQREADLATAIYRPLTWTDLGMSEQEGEEIRKKKAKHQDIQGHFERDAKHRYSGRFADGRTENTRIN